MSNSYIITVEKDVLTVLAINSQTKNKRQLQLQVILET